MVGFRKRKDNGQAFPLGGHKASGLAMDNCEEQREAFEQTTRKVIEEDTKVAEEVEREK
jgi:hypothetical protein